NVDDDAVAIDPLQRGQRAAVVAELAVVIILEDPGVASTRPLEQLYSALERQRCSERRLPRGSDVDHPRLRRSLDACIDIDAGPVDRDRHQPSARAAQDVPSTEMARVFHPDRVTLVEEQPRQEV